VRSVNKIHLAQFCAAKYNFSYSPFLYPVQFHTIYFRLKTSADPSGELSVSSDFENVHAIVHLALQSEIVRSIRRKLAALSSLFDYLCEVNAVTSNPVKGVKRPRTSSQEGKTPAIGDHQARSLLHAPDATH
jgi:site-specific recombinase XerC